jgi:hypothetical protein
MTASDVGTATQLGLSVGKLFPASVVAKGWLTHADPAGVIAEPHAIADGPRRSAPPTTHDAALGTVSGVEAKA